MSISAIARVLAVGWNTVKRWLDRARDACKAFSDHQTQAFELAEPQADEIRTFVVSKDKVTWVLSLLETTSRLWVSVVVGARSYGNVKLLFRDALPRSVWRKMPLITTDGFEPYEWAIRTMFKRWCIYGQVIKTYRKGRVSKVERRLVIGSRKQLKDALEQSEDSSELDTAFIERHNLTVRQGSAYLHRRTTRHARTRENLDGHLALLQCYYNFVRPHMSLKYGPECWTPAMQAGLARKRLSSRQIFESLPSLRFLCALVLSVRSSRSFGKIAA